MNERHNLNRRDFLYVSALAAGGTMLAACGGNDTAARPTPASRATASSAQPDAANPTQPPSGPAPTARSEVAVETPVTAAGGKYQEAPELAALVKAGKLPPVEERIPKNPYVVPHKWVGPGKYGGHMKMAVSDVWGTAHFIQESMYGGAPLRWLKDGLAIGPGLFESWKSNDDATVWTFHLREGLRWSDGKPLTTEDFRYWWEDLVLNEDHPEQPWEAARSSKGNAAKMQTPDDFTVVMTFDAPAPLTAARLANGVGWNGWFQPKHYLSQFHPKYNPKLKGKEDWSQVHDEKRDWTMNKDCPCVTGWKLKQYKEGVHSVWERNPFYYAVNKNGDQLPYIDGITNSYVQNPEVLKLRYTSGAINYQHGAFTPVTLSDVALLRQSRPKSKLEVRFWDSGSGTASVFFFNQDFEEPKMRELVRNPKFRKALSHAYNRQEVRKTVYFNQGEITTGTYSPKAIEYNVNSRGKEVYKSWRESALKYDPEMAKRMLDEIGVVDKNGDGWREMPDGGKLLITLDFGAPGSQEHIRKNEVLAANWKAIGINTRLNPLPSEGFSDKYAAGKILTKTAWEVGDGPDHLTGPWWLVPMERERWAPLQGVWYQLRGTPAAKQGLNKDPYKSKPPRVQPEAGSPVARLQELFDRATAEPDAMKRHQLVWEMVKVHIDDGPFFLGVVANYPQLVLVHEDMRNVPRREDLAQGGMVNTWAHPTPAVYDSESYYFENPGQHKA